jgi:hypothetical protein
MIGRDCILRTIALIECVWVASFGADVHATRIDVRYEAAAITHTRSFQNVIALGNFVARR